MFLDGPNGRPREAVHVLFAGEHVRRDYVEAAPDLTEIEKLEAFRVLAFEVVLS
jgi:hypothetical protein